MRRFFISLSYVGLLTFLSVLPPVYALECTYKSDPQSLFLKMQKMEHTNELYSNANDSDYIDCLLEKKHVDKNSLKPEEKKILDELDSLLVRSENESDEFGELY